MTTVKKPLVAVLRELGSHLESFGAGLEGIEGSDLESGGMLPDADDFREDASDFGSTFGGQLEEMRETGFEGGQVPDGLVEVLYSGSEELLASAKSFAKLGGNGTIALGIAASALEETAWAMAREAWWKVCTGLEELADQLQDLRNGFRSEADVVSRRNPESDAVGLIIDSGGSLGAAGHAFRVAAREIAVGRVNPGLQQILATGEILSAAGQGLLATADELKARPTHAWSDDCLSGQFKWEKEGRMDRVWVLYECVLEKGTFCNVCVWEAAGRSVRFHSDRPEAPESSE